ncbi:MAG: hypothetical protein PHG00_17755 [Methylococcales bacterium]|nr:hypothetical protein [Methylococcales bacterium]
MIFIKFKDVKAKEPSYAIPVPDPSQADRPIPLNLTAKSQGT